MNVIYRARKAGSRNTAFYFWFLLTSAALAAAVFACPAGAGAYESRTVRIQERFTEDPAAGYYAEGRFDRALYLWGSQPMVYPVFFGNEDVSEGTLSVWFKPMRKSRGAWDSQTPLQLNGIARVRLHSSGGEDDAWNLHLPNATVRIDDAFCEKFHHMVYTWDEQAEETYLDGELVVRKARDAGSPHSAAGGGAELRLASRNGQLIDELIVLDRYLSPEEVQKLHASPEPWKIDSTTVFYAPFDGTTAAYGVPGRGDVVRMSPHAGRVDATFLDGEPAKFLFRAFNATPRKTEMVLEYSVLDINRDTAARGRIPFDAGPESLTDVRVALDEIETFGLFWGTFRLLAGGEVVEEQTIPFGRSLAVRGSETSPEDMTTGFVIGRGLNPAAYQKWVLLRSHHVRSIMSGPDEWYFEQMDNHVDSLLEAGSMPVFHIGRPPAWFVERFPSRWGLHGYYFPDARDEEAMGYWTDFIRTVAERYKGRIEHYEFFAEYYGRAEPTAYGRLFNLTADILKDVDPDIQFASTLGGYYSWYDTVIRMIADTADYYTIHPYQFVSGADPSKLWDESSITETYLKTLKEYGASTRLANTEYGCWQALTHAVDEDGYPLTKEEFDRRMLEHMPQFVAQRGRAAYVDFYTAAFRAVRGHVVGLASGFEYAMWWSSEGGGMIADLHFARHTPTTASLAYANVSGILAGYRYVRRIDLGADYLYGYLFGKNGDYILVAFSDFDGAVVFPEVAGDDISVIDLYGNPVPHSKAGSAVKIHLEEITPVYVRGITGLPEYPKPVLVAENTEEYLYPGTRAVIRANVYNPLPVGMTARVTLNLPGRFGYRLPPERITLRANESREILFDVDVPLDITANQTAVIMLETNRRELGAFGYDLNLAARVSTVARYTENPPVIDGNLGEWGDVKDFPVRIDDPEQVISGVPYTRMYMRDQQVDWHGPDDLSARGAVAYDEQNLYIAFRVWDDKVMNFAQTLPIHIYNGDSLEIFIDGRREETMGASSYFEEVYHIKLAPRTGPDYRSDEEKPPFHHISKPQIDMEIEGFTYASELLDDGYTLELKIPFAAAFPAITPGPGTRMGLAFHLNDQDERKFPSEVRDEDGNDAGAKNKSTMLWGGEPGVSSDPSKLGILILGEK